MKEFEQQLSNNLQIRIVDSEQISRLASEPLPTYDLNNMGDRAFVGFAFFGPRLPHDLKRVDPDNDYSREQNLSPLELQFPGGHTKDKYHMAIVATEGKKTVGIMVCQWVKFSFDYWHYHVRYIDVHKEHKNQGVGTKLMKALNHSDFVRGRILLLSMLTKEGSQYIAHVAKRELKAKDYAVVFGDYIGKKPSRFGKFGGRYWD
jgi:ribosomal protein S18 acetylase RimI-like enzyme